MRILNLFADADGESHFREIDIECTNETPWGLKLSKRLPATAILFVEGTGTDADVLLQSPHPSPCRQYVIWLDAEYELTASDGEKRVIGVGEVVLAEDTTGKGISRNHSVRSSLTDFPELLKRYESISFADAHASILHLNPPIPCRILDIGAGTGRDAAGLVALGRSVVAVEPTEELRRGAMLLHRSPMIEWLDDSLPNLAAVRARKVEFDLVMPTAVWMHLDEAQREAARIATCGPSSYPPAKGVHQSC